MLFALIRKEIINNVLSFRFMVTLVLFFGLILISILFLTSDHQIRLRTHEASKAAHRDQILAFKGAEDQDQQFHEILYGGGGIYGDRAPQPLGIFVQGLDEEQVSPIRSNAPCCQARPPTRSPPFWGLRRTGAYFLRRRLRR